jgi:histone deacetylase HOS3
VVILDIDLHHGNGTQEIVWRLNALAHKQLQALAAKKNASPRKGSPKKPTIPPEEPRPPLQIFYGSLHDVNSYRKLASLLLSRKGSMLTWRTLLPACEELDPALIAAASLSIDGQAGGQYVRNVHLEDYSTSHEFHTSLYPSYTGALFGSALSFLRKTRADPAKSLVFVSAGFDASEHEYQGMSRHSRKVPTGFYRRFGVDVAEFADAHAGGKLVAVLEGGYSLRALSTGVGSLRGSLSLSRQSRGSVKADVEVRIAVRGFVDPTPYLEYEKEQGEDWWDGKLLAKYERLLPPTHTAAFQASKPKSGYTNGSGRKAEVEEAWFGAVRDAFERMEGAMPDRDPPVPAALAPRAVKAEEAEPLPWAATRQTRSRAVTPAATPTQRAKKTVAPPVPPTVPRVAQQANVPAELVSVLSTAETVVIPIREDAPLAAEQEAVQPAPAGPAAPEDGDGVSTPVADSRTQELQTIQLQQDASAASARPGKPLVRFTFKAGAIAPPPPVVTP